MQNTYVLIHNPGDYIFVMSEGGKVTAYRVERDGNLDPVNAADAAGAVSTRQKEERTQPLF